MEITLDPAPNPAITNALKGTQMRRSLETIGHTAQMLYQAKVAKRSNALAASARTSVHRGGIEQDRLVMDMTVGGQGPLGTVDYGAAHEFGTQEQHADSDAARLAGEAPIDQNPGVHDLNWVLQELHRW
ncbi:hypothetical protein [Mycobacteroides abscessus]|uniref:hypothetical protein n=1 Tax=Mycobacteroides abscessus TaxID=36809 RepID=UPI0018966A23